jgi:hypothetical protein
MKKTIDRLLKIILPKGRSAFLWRPRKTVKTTLLIASFPGSMIFDMLQTDLSLDLAKLIFYELINGVRGTLITAASS